MLHWDVEDEYRGERVTLKDLPALFRRRAFRAVYRPQYARRPEELPREFDALAFLLLELKHAGPLLLTVDEALAVLPSTVKTGGLGSLLFRGRKRGISVFYATQFISRLPGPLVGLARELVLFHLDGRGDQQVLRSYCDDSTLQRVGALPPHHFLTVDK